MLCLAVGCQLATVAISWPVWQVRQEPANLPLIPLPGVSFGIPVVISLLAALVWPRRGVAAHCVLVGLACVWDQYRVQPQFLSLIVLMLACVSESGQWFARWYLAAMWLWAGLHKFLSPEWFGSSSWWYLQQSGVAADTWHLPFAVLVAASEVALGLAAIVRPRLAAAGCLIMHLAILVSLSPWVRDFNASVWPWNLATAVVGFWLLRRDDPPVRSGWRRVVPLLLMLAPAAFYVDLLNPHLAFVLYSGNMPRAYHSTGDTIRRLDGWGSLAVPFPDSPHLLTRAFSLAAEPGHKLHIQDPRAWLPDRYFVQTAAGAAQEISRAQFQQGGPGSGAVRGMELADPETVWRLPRLGVSIRALEDGVSCSAAAQGTAPAAELLRSVQGLPNLVELSLEDADLPAGAWLALGELPRLEVLELRGCPLEADGLTEIAKAKELRYLHVEATPLTADGLRQLSSLRRLEVLRLPATEMDDAGLRSLEGLAQITWLDLGSNDVTDAGAAHLSQFPACEWINLSGTRITNAGAEQLAGLKNLEVVQLSQTRVGDEGLTALRGLSRLEHLDLAETSVSDAGCEQLAEIKSLRYLSIQGTQVTGTGVAKLRAALPECEIVE